MWNMPFIDYNTYAYIYLHVHLVLFITLIYTQIENHLIKQM
jgi:hypothetical protein